MKQQIEHSLAQAAPVVFVVLWSTGFIGTRTVLEDAEPLTYLAVRMALVVVLMAGLVAWFRPVWPNLKGIFHSAVAGLLMHGVYLGGVTIAVYYSVPLGLTALIPGLQPILTSTIAHQWLGERVTKLQWLGLLLGVAGVVLVLQGRPMTGAAAWGWLALTLALVSITLGALYQKRYCGNIDWRTGNVVQYAAVTLFFLVGSLLFETGKINWTPKFVFATFWLAGMLSVGSIGILYWLIKKQAATKVASLFYLVPATTALMAFVLFGEKLDTTAICGIAICASAVLLVNKAKA